MGAWDIEVLNADINEDFLDELSSLEGEDLVEGVVDAIMLVAKGNATSDEEESNGECAATIASIWAGAPYSASDAIDNYPFIVDPGYDIPEEEFEKMAEPAADIWKTRTPSLTLRGTLKSSASLLCRRFPVG